ncbi:MAG: class I SAM-dependent methyltransferase [Roseicyclus sp.]|uniref:class I SAM-dependent methyltransferase n=1 Tax=Roseicyclus sp. TaxID=1914329 RepID=UPI003A865BA5
MPKSNIQPDWLWDLLGCAEVVTDSKEFVANGVPLTVVGNIPRARSFVSEAQQQTRDTFGFKWDKRDTFEGGVASYMERWLQEKYGSVEHWVEGLGPNPIILDAGCGAAMSGLAYFGPVLDRVRYLGADVSTAVDVAAQRFHERKISAGFVQADLMALPLADASVDMVFSEGVLHHTDDTRSALAAVSRMLKPGGRILFYVYRRKGPVREFTDDFIREKMQVMTAEQGWAALEPLTKFGQVLGQLDIEIEVPEAINLLDIPAGRFNLQRFFYWHVCKAFYRPEMTLEEMNHINFDWFAPKNAHRQSTEEVRAWCRELGLLIEHEFIEEAGITIVARKAD